jgi:hypothetical protein
MRIGRMRVDNANHDPVTCSLEAKVPSAKSQQTCVALSTCEAEYYSATYATKEGLPLRQLMGETFNEPIDGTTTIWENNQSAIAYSHNALVSEKT